MAKAVIRLDCSDFEVEAAGQKFYPHEGEWLEVHVLMPVSVLVDSIAFIDTDEDNFERIVSGLQQQVLAVVAAWNWTDQNGVPFPIPSEDGTVLDRLSDTELGYILRKRREALYGGDDEKKDEPSPSTTTSQK